jgi:hypothetical protein
MISLYAVPEDDISIVSLSVVQEDADDNFDDLDLEQIEAEYRATRARAFFSAGAAARLVNLELVRYVCLFKDNVMILRHLSADNKIILNRARAEKTVKREKEVNFWKSQLEAKTNQLQAILSEQRNVLAWGPNSSEVCFFCCSGERVPVQVVLQVEDPCVFLLLRTAKIKKLTRVHALESLPKTLSDNF